MTCDLINLVENNWLLKIINCFVYVTLRWCENKWSNCDNSFGNEYRKYRKYLELKITEKIVKNKIDELCDVQHATQIMKSEKQFK